MLISPCIAVMRVQNLCPRIEKVLLNISGSKQQNNSERKKEILFSALRNCSWWKDWLSPVFNSEVLLQPTPQLDDDHTNQQRQTCIQPSIHPPILPSSILLLSSSKFTRERRSAPFLPHILESQGFLVRKTHTLQYPINHCE